MNCNMCGKEIDLEDCMFDGSNLVCHECVSKQFGEKDTIWSQDAINAFDQKRVLDGKLSTRPLWRLIL